MLISLTVLAGAGLLLVALFVILGRRVNQLRDTANALRRLRAASDARDTQTFVRTRQQQSRAEELARDLTDIIPGLLVGGLTLIALAAIFGFAWGIVVLLRGAL